MIILKVFLKIYEEDFLTQSIKPAFLLYKSQTQHPPPPQTKTYRTISPINISAAAAKSLQSCPTLCDPIDGSSPGPCQSLDSPGKNTGVGCHFLLRCMKVKSESEVAQSCLTLSDPVDCSPPGSSVHGIFQARVLEWGAIAFSEI